MGEELADVTLFVLSLAHMLDVDLEAELARKRWRLMKPGTYKDHNGHHVRRDVGNERNA